MRLEIQENDDWATSPQFHELVDRIVAVDPYNERALSVQSWVALYVHHDVVSAARFLERAMSEPSTDVEFLRGTSTILNGLGMNDEAMAVLAYVVDRDPTCLQCRYQLARAYRTAGLFGEAEAMMQSAMDLQPEDSAFGFALASTQLMNGKAQAALDWVEGEGDRNFPQGAALRVMALYDLGRVAEYQAALDDLLREVGEEQSLQVAEALAWTGDFDRAFHILSSPGADDWFFYSALNSPFLGRLRDDPRWQALLARHGIATEQIAALDIEIRLPPGVTIN